MDWSTGIEGVKTVYKGVGKGCSWVWNNATLAKCTYGLFTYGANTVFQGLEGLLALRTAVPTLVYNRQAKKIMYGAGYLLINDALFLIALNFGNTHLQNYCRKGHEQETYYSLYGAFLTVLTLVNYSITAFTWRQGVQTLIRNTIIESNAPSAFNSNKSSPPKSLCTDLKCNYKRIAKGMLREPLILLANDGFVWVIKNSIPYVGGAMATILNIFFHGRYQYRIATPERCERHKAMMQEEVLALGLGYEITTRLLDHLLEQSIGIPPKFYHRTLQHLLLLLHINLAAHSRLPLVEEKDATLYLDPLNLYERICRFLADVLFAGLMKRIPIDFKPVPGAAPLIPLSTALQWSSMILNKDKETEMQYQPPGVLAKLLQKLRVIILPPILQSAHGFCRDPIVTLYWPAIRQGGITTTEMIESIGLSKKVQLLSWAPKSVATVLNLKFGIPKKVTRSALMLSKEEDFWDFIDALKKWFERHNVKTEVLLADNIGETGLVRTALLPLPKNEDVTPIAPSSQLITERLNAVSVAPADALISTNKELSSSVISAQNLMPINRNVTKTYVTTSADSLFSTRRRKQNREQQGEIYPIMVLN